MAKAKDVPIRIRALITGANLKTSTKPFRSPCGDVPVGVTVHLPPPNPPTPFDPVLCGDALHVTTPVSGSVA